MVDVHRQICLQWRDDRVRYTAVWTHRTTARTSTQVSLLLLSWLLLLLQVDRLINCLAVGNRVIAHRTTARTSTQVDSLIAGKYHILYIIWYHVVYLKRLNRPKGHLFGWKLLIFLNPLSFGISLRCLCPLWNSAVKFTTRKLELWGYPAVKTAWL